MSGTFGRDARMSTLSRIIGYGASLAGAIVLARALGPEAKGTVSLGTAVPGMVALLAGLGLGAAATIGSREGWLPLRSARYVLWTYAIAVGAVAVALATLVIVVDGLPQRDALVVLAAASSIGGLLGCDYGGGLLQGSGRVRAGMWLRSAVGIGHAVGAVIVVALGAADPLPVLAVVAAWSWVCALAGVVLLRDVKGSTTPTSMATWLPRLAILGVRTQAIWVLLLLNFRADLALLGVLGTIADVGVYSIAVGFSEVAWLGVNALVAVLLPHLAGMDRAIADRRTARAVGLALLSTAGAAAAVSVALTVLGPVLFGPGFEMAPLAFAALAPGLVLMAAFKVLAVYAIATARLLGASGAALLGVVLNVVFNVILIPPFGSVGAGVASSLSYGVISLLAVVWFLGASGLRPSDILVPWRPHHRLEEVVRL